MRHPERLLVLPFRRCKLLKRIITVFCRIFQRRFSFLVCSSRIDTPVQKCFPFCNVFFTSFAVRHLVDDYELGDVSVQSTFAVALRAVGDRHRERSFRDTAKQNDSTFKFRWWMNVEHIHQRLPLNGCEHTFGQSVCCFIRGTHISNGN